MGSMCQPLLALILTAENALKQYALVHISEERETVGIKVTDSFCKGVHKNWESQTAFWRRKSLKIGKLGKNFKKKEKVVLNLTKIEGREVAEGPQRSVAFLSQDSRQFGYEENECL